MCANYSHVDYSRSSETLETLERISTYKYRCGLIVSDADISFNVIELWADDGNAQIDKLVFKL